MQGMGRERSFQVVRGLRFSFPPHLTHNRANEKFGVIFITHIRIITSFSLLRKARKDEMVSTLVRAWRDFF